MANSRKAKEKTKNANIIVLKDDDGELRTLDTEKVEILNNFFADVGENLAKKFGESDRCGNSFINRVTPVCDEIKLNEEKLLHQMLSLKPNKAIGDDMISGKELRSGGKSVMPGLKEIFMKSFESGKFPNTWKTAKLRSAFKKESRLKGKITGHCHFLSIPGKILEDQICLNLDSHLKMNGPQTPKQWGFQEGKSTEYLLLHMAEIWKKAIDEGHTVGVLLIDFRKAFDSINHDILKKKSLGCGVSGNMFDILCDYLRNRSQYAELNGTKSRHRVIKFGVPQGSLLGPRLFTMYINDLPDKITHGEAYLYADDSTFYYAGKNIEEVVDNLNMTGKQVNDWCQENQLTIHTGKSEVLIITNRDFVGPLRPVRIGTEIIQYVKTTSLLGIEVDNKLT